MNVNYYERHLGDYARDTGHLSVLEHGVYTLLLDAYYSRERPLPADARECCKLAHAASKPEKDAVAYILREFFVLGDDGYRQGKADKVIARFQDKQRKAAASANARWGQSKRNANASPDAMRTHSEGNAPNLQAPVTSNQDSLRSQEVARPKLSPEFESFLAETYPHSAHGNDHITALHSAMGLVGSGRATEADLRRRLTMFRAFVESKGYSDASKVPASQNWFAINRPNPYWAREWKPVLTKAEQAVDSIISEGAAFLRAGELQ